MEAIGVVDNIPVSAIGSTRTAARVNDSAEAVIRYALGLANGTATCQPARPRRRRCGTETPTQSEREDWRGLIDHVNFLGKRAERGPWRERGRGNSHGVSIEGWHLY